MGVPIGAYGYYGDPQRFTNKTSAFELPLIYYLS
jgi:hypothetical protein